MRPFSYIRAADVATAIGLRSRESNGRFLGGGTNLVDLMREDLEQPDALVDVTGLLLQEIRDLADGSVSIGAAAKNTATAAHQLIRERYPVLSQAIVCGASGQIRNMATVAGNMMQRTRCCYFYDTTTNCNKRLPGSGCDAIDGFSRTHAILGASGHCIATHPSDMCVALAALDATVHVQGPGGTRAIPFVRFHRLPGDTPHLETALEPDELITSVQIPPLAVAANSMYRKVRDRSSYAFALVSVAAAVATSGGVVTDVRIALGGVAHRPWRAFEAERVLRGGSADERAFGQAAEAELAAARPTRDNGFKIELARRTMVSVLRDLVERGSAR